MKQKSKGNKQRAAVYDKGGGGEQKSSTEYVPKVLLICL